MTKGLNVARRSHAIINAMAASAVTNESVMPVTAAPVSAAFPCWYKTKPSSAPAAMTHLSVPDERKQALGITDNLVRISIGVEDADDLIDDLQRALRAAAKAA